MSTSASLYKVTEKEFQKIVKDPSCFELEMSEQCEIFDQNFDGLIYLLSKSVSADLKQKIDKIFYPIDYLGEKIDYYSCDMEDMEAIENYDETISYLTPQLVSELSKLLKSIDKASFLSKYNSQELNSNGIYPYIWHDDESENQAFNKKHLAEGFDSLIKIFNRSHEAGNYILAFVG